MRSITRHLIANQLEQDDPRQVKNSAGGYSFKITPQQRLRRFLILGSEGGSYYASERQLTRENIANLQDLIAEPKDALEALQTIVEISDGGLAPRNTPAIFALAAITQKHPRLVDAATVNKVLRIGTHWLQFAAALKAMGGWGSKKRRLIAQRFETMPSDDLAYDMAKYQSRDGWSQADLLRVSHPTRAPEDREAHALFRWALKADMGRREVTRKDSGKTMTYNPVGQTLPRIIEAMIHLHSNPDLSKAVKLQLIVDNRLSREMVPTEMLKDPMVWKALLPAMGMTAVLRNMRNMAKLGLLKPFEDSLVMGKLTEKGIISGRIHPIQILQAMSALDAADVGPVSPKVRKLLENLFYVSFKHVEPSNKRFLLGLDVSGSMAQPCGNMGLSCAEGTAIMAMVTMRTEPDSFTMGFCDQFLHLPITADTTLQHAKEIVQKRNFGGTDCALPMKYASKHNLKVDTFVVMTDSETWAGNNHPHRALQDYRQKSGIDAKMVVVGMVSNDFSIADPSDPGMLDVVGFDASAPRMISAFAAGKV